MTAQTSDVYSDNLQSTPSDEIDLRQYILVFIRWWREIFAITLLTGVIAAVVVISLNNMRTPVYNADADLIITRLASNIQLDDRVVTTSNTPQIDLNSWRTSLLQLVKSSVVANRVIEEMGDELPEYLRSPAVLLNVITAKLLIAENGGSPSNIIRVTATTVDPEVAASLANSWADQYVSYVHGLYGEVPQAMLESVEAELEQSHLAYESAQLALEEFVATNQMDTLERQILEKSKLRDELMLNHTQMLSAVVTSGYKARLSLYSTLAQIPAEHASEIIQAQSLANVGTLNRLYQLRGSAAIQLDQARNMEASLVGGGEAAAKSNVSALQMLKLAVFTALQEDTRLPLLSTVPFENIQMSLDEQLADTRALIAVLEEYIGTLDTNIRTLSEAEVVDPNLSALTGVQNNPQSSVVGTGVYSDVLAAYAHLLTPGNSLEQLSNEVNSAMSESQETLMVQLENEIRALQAASSAEKARERQLIYQRDQAWTTYETVGSKLRDLSLLRSSSNSEVRMGNPALPPVTPKPPIDLFVPVAAALAAGFLFAVILAFIVDAIGGQPFFARRSA